TLIASKVFFLIMAAAKTAKNKSSKTTPSPTNKNTARSTSKRNIRLVLGFLLLLVGSFFTLSILSYCFTWKEDQNHLISAQSISSFLFTDTSAVQNWCGRLGAVAAHLLVFRGVGIASLLFTTWMAAWGIN